MRPIRLLLSAFGPYKEKTELHFSSLAQQPLYLIAGATGGGKTSLLDAICFALYCKATGGRRGFGEMRCLSAREDSPTEVEFDFALGNQVYRFSRSRYIHINRSTKLPEFRENHQCFQLENDEFRLLKSGSETAVREQAQLLLGLTAEQFSQVIVLPQGDFLRLLRANSREKADMLETLFSAGVWRKLSEKLQGRLKRIQEHSRKLTALSASLLEQEGVQSPDELKALLSSLETQQNALQLHLQELGKQLQAEETHVKSLTRGLELQRAKTQAVYALEKNGQSLQAFAENAPIFLEKQAKSNQFTLHLRALTEELGDLRAKAQVLERIKSTEAEAEKARLSFETETQKADELKIRQQELSHRMEKGQLFVKDCVTAAEQLTLLNTAVQQGEEALRKAQELHKLLESHAETQKSQKENSTLLQKKQVLAAALLEKVKEGEAALHQDTALFLAQTLEKGVPCPVCGSPLHPAPAHGTLQHFDQEAWGLLRQEQEQAAQEASALLLREEALLKTLNEQEETLKTSTLKGCLSLEQAKKQLDELLSQQKLTAEKAERLRAAEDKVAALAREKDQLAEEEAALRAALSGLLARHEALCRESREGRATLGTQSVDQLLTQKEQEEKELRIKNEALLAELRQFEDEKTRLLTEQKLRQEQLSEAEKNLSFHPLSPEDAANLPERIAELTQRVSSLRREENEASVLSGSIHARKQSLEKTAASVAGLCAELEEVEKNYGTTARLAKSLSGSNPQKTPILQYVLSMMLEEVLHSANRFLSIFSRGRYALRRMEGSKGGNTLGGLDLDVLDGSVMLPRSIETLSGGEQFLASLSLAFGLSDVVQNHSGAVRLDALFIDEGFGSLDAETLDTAMKALALLQSSGRQIGLISHVAELRNRIPARIEVTKDGAGFAKAHIVLA